VDTLVQTLAQTPHGVLEATAHDPDQPFTSTNLGVLRLRGDELLVTSMARSPSEKSLDGVEATLHHLATEQGGSFVAENGFPGWEPDPSSPLLALMHATYTSMFGKKAKTLEIHAGLECGSLKQKYPEMDVVSMGPDIRGAHTPEEEVSVASVARSFALLRQVVTGLQATPR
jgi:dipeptidase D